MSKRGEAQLMIQREAVVSAIRRARRDRAEYEARTLENVVYLLDNLREALALTDKKTLN